MQKIAAGLIMYRKNGGKTQIFLVHPGGPFWQNKDLGVWSIPKGLMNEGETDLLEVAKREFKEETGLTPKGEFIQIGSAKKKDGKVVTAFAFESDFDPKLLKSNTTFIEWPPKTGRRLEIPEVDKGEFFDIEEAKERIVPYQRELIEEFEKKIS